MKYKAGDRVRVQSLGWYNENKNKHENVPMGQFSFNSCNKHLCGTILTIKRVLGNYYLVKENDAYWTDEMIEGLVEDEIKPNIIEEAKTYWDSIKDAWICPEGYIFKDENGNVINATKIVLEKKKKEYPKTYEECSKIAPMTWGGESWEYYNKLISSFYRLLICRDAYWKIAGEEMGLGKPWEPNWSDYENIKYIIGGYDGEIGYDQNHHIHKILAFPTEEMRDAFYENFKEEIEFCKELL